MLAKFIFFSTCLLIIPIIVTFYLLNGETPLPPVTPPQSPVVQLEAGVPRSSITPALSSLCSSIFRAGIESALGRPLKIDPRERPAVNGGLGILTAMAVRRQPPRGEADGCVVEEEQNR